MARNLIYDYSRNPAKVGVGWGRELQRPPVQILHRFLLGGNAIYTLPTPLPTHDLALSLSLCVSNQTRKLHSLSSCSLSIKEITSVYKNTDLPPRSFPRSSDFPQAPQALPGTQLPNHPLQPGRSGSPGLACPLLVLQENRASGKSRRAAPVLTKLGGGLEHQKYRL